MVRIGIIGCGGMGKLHAGILKGMEGIEIIAASDINETQVLNFKNGFNISKVFTDYRKTS